MIIPVTKTFLPPIEEYTAQVQRAYNNHWLTNRGELVKELETKLKDYLRMSSNITITNNGTVPLQIALRLLANGGEVITTPFSYVATTAAIVWEHCTPVFVDIHPEYLTIDETKIEAAITPKTTAILATHVFGNPCDVEAIEAIAQKHNLKVIYDAAHCFGVTYKGKSIFDYGDVSTCSFHATKLFHTAEGGAMFCKDEVLNHQLFYTHNFGHNGPLDFYGLGINAKISEIQAAMGLSVLQHINAIIKGRQRLATTYHSQLSGSFQLLKLRAGTEWNYSYFPVLFESEEEVLKTQAELNKNQIYPRRYFYPSLNTVPYTHGKKMILSESVAKRILCLPLYHDLSEPDVIKICELVISYA